MRYDTVYYGNRDKEETIVRELTTFAEVNRYLTKFYRNARVKYTLDNMRELMEYLGNPQDTLQVVHVAGTSGKTSTAYYVAGLLTAAGQKTGLTVSPHVDEINERLQIDGVSLAEAPFCAALTEFLALVEAGPIKPSWFEVMVAFVYWYFAHETVDYAVIETGLGGLKDGTNVVTRADKVCILTDIGLDHVNVLGDTLAAIAEQKAGIVQPRNVVFTYRQAPEIMTVFERRCQEQQATLHVIEEATAHHEYPADLTSLPEYQQRNWLLAYQAYQYLQNRDSLKYLTSKVLQDTQSLQVPGRMEIRQLHGKTFIMDGAHNVQKMTAFMHSFQRLYPGVKPAILISLKDHKDYEAVAALLAPLVGTVIITTFETTQDTPFQAMDPTVLAAAFAAAHKSSQIIMDQTAATQALMQTPESVCLIIGSFYLLSQLRGNQPELVR